MVKNCIAFTVFVLGCLILLSCGKGDTIQSDIVNNARHAQDFYPEIPIFPRPLDGDVRMFYDTDVAAIVVGPQFGPGHEGEVWGDSNGRHWAVAVSLAEPQQQPNQNRNITYRFLSYDWGSGEVVSPLLDVTLQPGQGLTLPADVRFARVAACWLPFGQAEQPLTAVEVTIVFQAWVSNSWQIGIHRMFFAPADFANIGSIQPMQGTYTYFIANAPNALMMPDVAYDPRWGEGIQGPFYYGDIYVVYTRQQPSSVSEVYGVRGTRLADYPIVISWGTPQLLQWTDHNGFHPRIAIGKCQLFLVTDFRFAIAYTGVNYEGADVFRTFVSRGLLANFPTFQDDPIGASHAGGIPSIDIGPPGTPFGAVAWTQSRSQSWDDVTVAVLDSLGGLHTLHPTPGLLSSANPSVAVSDTDGPPYEINVSYLMSFNPNSHAWNPAARRLYTPGSQGAETVLSTTIHGDFDTGSQFTNCYALATALTVYNDIYWSLWSSRQGNQEGLNQVHGAYGYNF